MNTDGAENASGGDKGSESSPKSVIVSLYISDMFFAVAGLHCFVCISRDGVC